MIIVIWIANLINLFAKHHSNPKFLLHGSGRMGCQGVFDAEAGESYYQGHQGGEVVEDAVGQVDEGAHAQHGRLCDAA